MCKAYSFVKRAVNNSIIYMLKIIIEIGNHRVSFVGRK